MPAKWEYKVVAYDFPWGLSDLGDQISQKYGQDGWELVSVATANKPSGPPGVALFFKRQVGGHS
jgi:Domain of unknown function (DUF4177)